MIELRKRFSQLVSASFVCCVMLTILVLSRVFLFATFKIPSSSMQPTLMTGDYILVSKWYWGPRFYNFVKPITKSSEILRLPGLHDICLNDVLVFNAYKTDADAVLPDINKFLVKRCTGIPGDIYKIETEEDLKKSNDIVIPGKGFQIEITQNAISQYGKYIEWETGMQISTKDDLFLLNDSIISTYVFSENYYFVVGDNTEYSVDSRSWGLVPESFIVGKAELIWYAKQKGKINWNRMFTIVR